MKVELVYIGAMISAGDLVHAYAPIDDAGQLADRAWMYPTAFTDHPPGSHLRFDCDGNDLQSVRGETGVYVRAWSDRDAVLAWDAAHIAAIGSHRAYAIDPPIRLVEAMKPIRNAYRGMSQQERAVLIAQVVQCIVGES